MFDDLQTGDPRFERYLRKGLTQADAALQLFLEKHSPRLKSVGSMESTASTPTMTVCKNRISLTKNARY